MDIVAEPLEEEEEPEKDFGEIDNMTRVLPTQLEYVQFTDKCRYTPIRKTLSLGISLLDDLTPHVDEELIEISLPTGKSRVRSMTCIVAPSAVQEEEVTPPEPFEYPFNENTH
jgi:26S proteasome regulatory subunit N2